MHGGDTPACCAPSEASLTLSRPSLTEFSTALTARLPGEWSSVPVDLRHPETKNRMHEQLWHPGLAYWALQAFVPPEAGTAMLLGPGDERLLLLHRPLARHRRDTVVVSAFVPPGLTAAEVEGLPVGPEITVPPDPARAADQIRRRLLPRYSHCLHAWALSLRDASTPAEQTPATGTVPPTPRAQSRPDPVARAIAARAPVTRLRDSEHPQLAEPARPAVSVPLTPPPGR